MRKLSAPRSVEGCEMTLAGGIAWADGRTIYATGGVNKDIFLDAISGRYKLVRQTEYLLQPIGIASVEICIVLMLKRANGLIQHLPTRLWRVPEHRW